MADLATNINQAISDFGTIKQAIINKGIEVPNGTKTSEYGNLINNIIAASDINSIYPIGEDGRPTGDVVIPDNVTNLSKYPFIENSNVLTVALPESLRGLADYCFQKCTGLQDITISNKVTTIPQYCFDGCSSLSKVTLPKGLTTIDQYAFQNCTKLHGLVIPDDIKSLSIKKYAFSGCRGLDNDTVTKLATKTYGTIYAYAFSKLTGITEITTNYAFNYYFSGCTNLKKVTILKAFSNDGSFGSNVFEGCSNLTAVILPDTATILNNNFFNGCTALTTVNFPETITKIEDRAFYNCSSLQDLDIPENSSYTLGASAFHRCGINNEFVNKILSHATSVGNEVFRGCLSLTELTDIPILSSSMFQECTNLISVSTKGILTTTGIQTFYGCTSLVTAILNEGILEMGNRVFYNCKALKTVYLPSSINSTTTSSNSSLTSTSSSYYAFYGCSELEDVQLGQNWNMSLRLNVSSKITGKSILNMFNSLKDLTGDTAKTLTLGTNNLQNLKTYLESDEYLTSEELIKYTYDEALAIATNKNWTIA